MSDFQSINSLIKSSLTPKDLSKPGPFDIDSLSVSKRPPFFKPHEIKIPKNQSKIPHSKKIRLAPTGDPNISSDFLNFLGIEEQSSHLKPVATYRSEKRNQNINFYPLSSFNISNDEPHFDAWYFVLKDYIQNFYQDKPLITSNRLSISLSGKNLRIDLKHIRMSIYCKGTLFDLSKSIKNRTFSPFNDLMDEVILPFTKEAFRIEKSISKRISSSIQDGRLDRHHRVNVDSLNIEDVDLDVSEYIDEIMVDANLANTFESLVSCRPYYEHFPARDVKRDITVIVAPTNSGKTYKSCQMVKAIIDDYDKATANCLFPLRALAYQIKDDFTKDGYACELITGEERVLEEGARISSCTTETIDTAVYNDVTFIDECQLIFDRGRESAYTRAIFGAYCSKLILCVAPAYADALITLIKKFTNDNVKTIELKRLCPLKPAGKVKLHEVEKGDVVVAYRVSTIHRIAESLKKQGLKVGVIYGRMSPSSRRKMIQEFSSRDCDVLVATDAIGMGLSIPARRVLIAEGVKFDGQEVRALTQEEIRQVAGRAGRYGFYDIGYAGVLNAPEIIEEKRAAVDTNVREAISTITKFKMPSTISVSPDKHVVRSAKNINLCSTLEIWKKSVLSHNNIEIAEETFSSLMDKAVILDRIECPSRDLLVSLLFIVYPSDNSGTWEGLYNEMAQKVINGESLIDFEWERHFTNYSNDNRFSALEDESSFLTLLSQFQRVAPELCPSEDFIFFEQEHVGEKLTELLLEKYAPYQPSSKEEFYASKVFYRAKKKLRNACSSSEVSDYISRSIVNQKQFEAIIKIAHSQDMNMIPLIT